MLELHCPMLSTIAGTVMLLPFYLEVDIDLLLNLLDRLSVEEFKHT